MAKANAAPAAKPAPKKAESNGDLLRKLQDIQASAREARAKADMAQARADLQRAAIEAKGKQVITDWSGDKPKTKVVDL